MDAFIPQTCVNCDHDLVESRVPIFSNSGEIPAWDCHWCGAKWTADRIRPLRGFRKPPPEGTQLSLVWEPNGTSHDDLVLRLDPKQIRRVDSYYFGLDKNANGTRDVLRLLLEQWMASVEQAEEGEMIFLPYGLFDEGTEALICAMQPTIRAHLNVYGRYDLHAITTPKTGQYRPLRNT